MVFLHERIPNMRSASISDSNGDQLDLSQLFQSAGNLVESFGNIGLSFRTLPYEEVFTRTLRQWNQTLSMQSEQGREQLISLRLPLGARQSSQPQTRRERQRREIAGFLFHRGSDPCNHFVGEFLSTCIHEPHVARSNNGVQQNCGACSGQRRG